MTDNVVSQKYHEYKSNTYFNWHDQSRLKYDPCARKAYDAQSVGSGKYKVNTPGYKWNEHSPAEYAANMSEPIHYQKQHRSAHHIDKDSELRYADLTDKRYIHQLMTRPYLGAYMGAGQNSQNNKDVESELIQGLDTRGGAQRSCDVLAGVSIDRFECLPEYGNPQRVQHIVEPWTRGGENTRDYVRRINYEAKCLNSQNNKLINKKKL